MQKFLRTLIKTRLPPSKPNSRTSYDNKSHKYSLSINHITVFVPKINKIKATEDNMRIFTKQLLRLLHWNKLFHVQRSERKTFTNGVS